jgi:HEAT repeat protein
MKKSLFLAIACMCGVVGASSESFAQTLSSRIASSSARSVQFSYAARPGVCGDGETFISTRDGFVGSYSTGDSRQCQPGPVRVVLDLADRAVIGLRTYVGGGAAGPAVVDLGTVQPGEAADYLLTVAARADGRVGRDAISAALLGHDVEASARLLDIARDTGRPLETRSAAVSGLARSQVRDLDRIGASLVQMARNEDDSQRIRSQALAALSRLEGGAGVQPLIQLANANTTSWIGRESMSVLARSGDPRARQFLRTVVQRTDLPDEMLAAALRGLGGSYVTGQDAQLLRSIFPRLTGTSSRNAVLGAIATLGGTENVQWLMAIVRDERIPSELRRRALQHARRAGAPTASLVALYDPTEDTQMRASLISYYASDPNKAATDKLVSIARNEQNLSLRRRAISALSRTSDPSVKQALQAIVEQ